MQFDIIWKDALDVETVLATATNTFVPNKDTSDAVPYEEEIEGIAADPAAGDLLILRFTTVSGELGAYYIPNGDGALVSGSVPNITLPDGP